MATKLCPSKASSDFNRTINIRVGFAEARELVLWRLGPLPPVRRNLVDALDHVLAAEVTARVDVPSFTSCLRDGVAIRSVDVVGATECRPVTLKRVGRMVAGCTVNLSLGPAEAIEVTTGAPLPAGADAVVESERVLIVSDFVQVYEEVRPGRHLLPQGADVVRGGVIAVPGEILSPGRLALLAASGVSEVDVIPRPNIVVISTGDEIASLGQPLRDGQLYASNLLLASGWLRRLGCSVETLVVPDDLDALMNTLRSSLERADAVITAGGAWGSERDLTVRAATSIGGELCFHRVRLGPGKAAALLLVSGKPIFCLPGGPPSFEAALLHLVLPGLLRMAGRPAEPFPRHRLALTETVPADPDWTRSVGCQIIESERGTSVRPRSQHSRLRPDPAVLLTPEGGAEAGQLVDVFDLTSIRLG